MSGVTDAGEVKDKSKNNGVTGSGSANSASGTQNNSNTSEFGFGISGDAGINYVVEDIKAYISSGIPVSTTDTGAADPSGTDADDEIRVAAKSKALLVSGIGALAVSNNGGLAGAFALNEITQNVTAYIENSEVDTAGDVRVTASGEDDLIAVTLGGSGQRDTSQSGFTVAGSVTVGRLTHTIKAYLGAGAIVHADDVQIEAVQDTLLINIAGAFSVAGRAAVGLSLDFGTLNATVNAWVDGGAAIIATGDVTISARNDAEVLSISAALSIATDSSGIGASAAATGYDVTHNVAAWIGAGGETDVSAHRHRLHRRERQVPDRPDRRAGRGRR
jgi:hypothetical protein